MPANITTTTPTAPLRHYLQFKDFSREEYQHLFTRTRWIRDQFRAYQRYWPLLDRTLVMIFEKQSTRTRPLMRRCDSSMSFCSSSRSGLNQ